MTSWISPSHINLFEYCEYQFYLVKCLGMEPKKTSALFQGEKVHEKLKDSTEATGVSFRDGLPLAFSGKISTLVDRELSVYSRELQMIGQIDEVQVDKGIVRIIEDKPGRLAHAHKLQVTAYAVLFREMFGDYPIELVVRDRDSGRIKWKKRLLKSDVAQLMRIIGKMKRIMEGKEIPRPTRNFNKCKKCGVNYACEFFRKRKEMGLIRV